MDLKFPLLFIFSESIIRFIEYHAVVSYGFGHIVLPWSIPDDYKKTGNFLCKVFYLFG